jgi:hypothetical protein
MHGKHLTRVYQSDIFSRYLSEMYKCMGKVYQSDMHAFFEAEQWVSPLSIFSIFIYNKGLNSDMHGFAHYCH